jgi:hypothetical protein
MQLSSRLLDTNRTVLVVFPRLFPSFGLLPLSDIIRTKAFDLAAMRAARSCVSDEVPNKKNDQRDRHAKTECDVPVHMALVSLFPAGERTGQRKG